MPSGQETDWAYAITAPGPIQAQYINLFDLELLDCYEQHT